MARTLADLSAYLQSGSSLARQQRIENHPALPVPGLIPLLAELPRGGIAEVTGPRSSGRMAVILHVLAQATHRGEVCAVLDTHDQFSPGSAADAGVLLPQIVWVRGQNRPDDMLRAADLLLHAGGFGVIVLDLPEVTPEVWNRVPTSWWYRFQRAVQNTPAILLLCTGKPQARACAQTSIELTSPSLEWQGNNSFALFNRMQTLAYLRKPMGRPAATLSIRAVC